MTDLLLDIILINKVHLAIKLLENIDSKVLMKIGRFLAIKKARENSQLPIYNRLAGINKIRNYDDFLHLPIIDKDNYIKKYPLEKRTKQDINFTYTYEQSSGYSGEPTYWPRYKGQDDDIAFYLKIGIEKTFRISKKKTLGINTFALGTWVTGLKTARLFCELANDKSNLYSIVNTGTVISDVLNALRYLTKYYDQVIIYGYPPFVKNVVEEAVSILPNDSVKKINIVVGGEGITEEWREHVAKLLKINILNFDRYVCSAYGAADTGIEIGYEQPITILLRKLLIENHELRYQLLGLDIDVVPVFFQYNPLEIWIEEIEHELVFTATGGVPVTRYNLHDRGGLISFNDVEKIIKSSGYDYEKFKKYFKPFRLPICYVFGRSDGTISLDGVNIYIQEFESIFNNPDELIRMANYVFEHYSDLYNRVKYSPLAKILFENAKRKAHLDRNLVEAINTFKVASNTKNISLWIELKENMKLPQNDTIDIRNAFYQGVVLMLLKHSKNYQTLIHEQLRSCIIDLKIEEFGDGIFSNKPLIKNKYIVTI